MRTRVPRGTTPPATERADHCSDFKSTTPSGSRSLATTPSVPMRPSGPFAFGMRRARIAAVTTVAKNRTSNPATRTITHFETWAFGTDGLNRVSPPRIRQTAPPIAGTPIPGCFSSRRKNRPDASSSTMPMIWTGSTPNVTKAATRQTMPRIPGTDNPGCSSSITMSARPR